MDKSKIPIDEFTYRGIESIPEPNDLCHIFETIIRSLPKAKSVTKVRCIEEFQVAWNREHED